MTPHAESLPALVDHGKGGPAQSGLMGVAAGRGLAVRPVGGGDGSGERTPAGGAARATDPMSLRPVLGAVPGGARL